MTTPRIPLALGVAALATTLLAGCFGPGPVTTDPGSDPGVTETEVTDPSADFVGTTWYTDGSEGPQGCEGFATLLADGTFDYSTKCADETEYREYVGAEDNSTWVLEGTTMTLSYNDGYNVCEGPATLELLDLYCVNQAPDQFPRVFVPAP